MQKKRSGEEEEYKEGNESKTEHGNILTTRKNIKKQMEEAKTPEQATMTALKYRELDQQVKKKQAS